jgi:hypothetical protein
MIIKKESLIAALARFRDEIQNKKIDRSEYMKILSIFADAYKRSFDYDLAFMRAFDELNVATSRKSFNHYWKTVIGEHDGS